MAGRKPKDPNNPEGKLTLPEVRFVGEYLIDFNGARAFKDCGLAEIYGLVDAEDIRKRAKLFLEQGKIKRACQEIMDRAIEATNRTAADVIGDVQRVSRKAELIGKYADALKGLELEGKFHKIFVDKVELDDINNRAAQLDAARERAKNGC